MNRSQRQLGSFIGLTCLLLATGGTVVADSNMVFDCDVTVDSNLVVDGAAQVTNFIGNGFGFTQNASSPDGNGFGAVLDTTAPSDTGSGIGVGWIIGGGYNKNGGGSSLIIEWGGQGNSSSGGDVILNSGTTSGGPSEANLTLYGCNLYAGGGSITLTAGNSSDGGGTGVSMILGGGGTATNGNGGSLFIQAGAPDTSSDLPGEIVIADAEGGSITIASSNITDSAYFDTMTFAAPNGIYALNNLYATNVIVTGTVTVPPQGDLSMGTFTNSPPH